MTLTEMQLRTVERARAAIERRGGVLIADRVGAGKTFIAVRLIEEALRDGAGRVLVTGPAGIRQQWVRPLRAAAGSAGAVVAAGAGARPPGAAVIWLSHTQLSLGRWPAWLGGCDLVVVDEAHAFRNPRTRRYRSLAVLCGRARVVLLTATPINNSLLDLYRQLRLFLGEAGLSDLGVPDLGDAFRAAARCGGRRLEPPLDGALAAVVVRSRPSRGEGGRMRRPRRAPPIAIPFELDPGSAEAFERAVAVIRSLELRALEVAEQGRRGTAGLLVRLGLVKRLESSTAAFLSSITALRSYLDGFVDAAAQGRWLRPADRGRRGASERADQLLLVGLALRPLPPWTDPDSLIESTRRDSSRLGSLAAVYRRLSEKGDAKRAALQRLLTGHLAGRKVLVFSEFRDTAVHVWKGLRGVFAVGLIHGGGAWIGSCRAGRRETVRRFAPSANGADPPRRLERVDVLISTDVLAEGFNLQDAADVVSYDLPWNPVRLIQRVGRIDRLGSPHRTVHCYNFVPAQGLDLVLGLVDRLEAKLDAIRAGVGIRERVLGAAAATVVGRRRRAAVTPVEPVTRTIRRLRAGDPDLFADLERAEEGVLGLDDRVCDALRTLAPGAASDGAPDPERIDEGGLPFLSHLPARAGGPQGWLVVLDTEAAVRWLFVWKAGRQFRAREDRAGALSTVLAVLESGAGGVSPAVHAPDRAEVSRVVDAALGHLERERPGSCGRRDIRRPVIRELMRSLAAEPGGPATGLCARADAVAEAFGGGVRAGVEIELEAVLRWARSRRRPGLAPLLLDRLETALEARGDTRAARPIDGTTVVVAILWLTAPAVPTGESPAA